MFDPLAWQLAFLLLLIGLAGYPGCCSGTGWCSVCEGDSPTSISLTFASVVDGILCDLCDTNFNATFILARTAIPCGWQTSGTLYCDTGHLFTSISYVINCSMAVVGSDVVITTSLDLVQGTGRVIWEWKATVTGVTTIDCAAMRSTTQSTRQTIPNVPCAIDWPTCQIN